MLRRLSKEKKKPTLKDILKWEKEVDILIKNRLANGVLVAFLSAVFFSLLAVFLKGVGLLEISDSILGGLLVYTLAHVPALLFAVIKLFYSK